MTFCDIIILSVTIICVAGLICVTIKRSKRKNKTDCKGCPYCDDKNCPFNR